MSVFGYKAMTPGMVCRGFRYSIGEVYDTAIPPMLCRHGFHFCKNVDDVWDYYDRESAIVFEVEALGDVVTDGTKSCTNRIRIVRRMDPVAEGRARHDAMGNGCEATVHGINVASRTYGVGYGYDGFGCGGMFAYVNCDGNRLFLSGDVGYSNVRGICHVLVWED